MAKVKNYTGGYAYPPVTEDPRTGSNAIYFYGQQHDKQTLSPEYDKSFNIGTSGYSTYSTYSHRPQDYYNQNEWLQLSKPTTNVCAEYSTSGMSQNTNNGYNSRHDDNPWWTINPDYERGQGFTKVTNGGQSMYVVQSTRHQSTNAYTYNYYTAYSNPSSDLSEMTPVSDWNTKNYDNGWHLTGHVSTWNSSYMPGVTMSRSSWNSTQYFRPNYMWIAPHGFPSSISMSYSSESNLGDYRTPYYIGRSTINGNRDLYMVNDKRYPERVFIYGVEWNSNSPTLTTMYSNTTDPVAAGTHQGAPAWTGKDIRVGPSKFFDDPRDPSGNTKCWFYPYADSYLNYHPMVITWDTTTDTFTQETDINITGDMSSVHQDLSSYYSNTNTYNTGMMFNETFVSAGTRYVTLMPLDMNKQYESIAGCRTFITYSVDASDPSELTYHSAVTVPTTAQNIVFLNDSKTLLGVFSHSSFYLYSFNSTTGWSLSSTIPEHVYSCGRDSLDRIWYLTKSSKLGSDYFDTHLLSPSLPVTITIDPENANYTYAGTTINTYVNVNAIGAAGDRLATTVKLVIEGASMQFSDGSVVKTITTSTSADTQVAINITGAGYSNIVASVEL